MGPKKNILDRLINNTLPDETLGSEGGVTYWRDRILITVLALASLAGLVVYIPAMVLVFKHQLWLLGILDTIIYAWCISLLFVRRRLPYRIRAWLAVPLLYIVGLTVLLYMGPMSGGPAWLFAYAVVSAVLLGVRATILSLFVNALTLVIIGWLMYNGHYQTLGGSMGNLVSWAVAGTNFMFLNALAAISVALLLRGLDQTVRDKHNAAARLNDQKSRLSKAYQRLSEESKKRKKAQEARRRSDEMFRRSFELSAVGMAMVSAQGNFLAVNSHFSSMIGYSSDELTGMVIADISHPDDRELSYKMLAQIVEGQKPSVQFEKRYLHKDGTVIWALVSSSMVDGHNKSNPTFISHIQDITAAKTAERALRQSQEKFSKVFGASPVMVVLSTLEEGRYIDVNQAYLKATGYRRDQVIGRKSIDLGIWVDPAVREQITRTLRRDGSVHNLEVQRQSKNGEIMTALYSAEPITLEGAECLISVSVDITERKQAEINLRKSEQRYQDLFNSISDLIYTHDLEGRFLSVNQAALETLGYQREELIGAMFEDFMPPEYRGRYNAEYVEQLSKDGHSTGTAVLVDKGGNRHYLEYSNVLVRPSQGEHYISGSCREVTGRIKAERELAQLQVQLMQAQKMEAVGTLAAGIAHDFNNILQAMRGNLDIVSAGSETKERNQYLLEQTDHLIDRAAGLVKGLLTFSRKVESERKPLDLNCLVESTVDILERTIPKMIRIETDLDPALDPIMGDGTHLEQVLLNLSANARDAMPAGGILNLATGRFVVDKQYRRTSLALEPGDYVLLSVSDTGQGMSEEVLAQIFNPFFTTKEVSRGTGLGLSTVFGVIKEHDGEITCQSRPGQGTTFRILLPAVSQVQAVSADDREGLPSLPQGSETIMLVDDEEAIRENLGGVLSMQGFTVLTADSGEKALEMFSGGDHAIELVVLDLGMPGMGGEACLHQLLQADPNLKVIIASGYLGSETLERDLDSPQADFMAKPYRLGAMVTKIREILDR